MFVDYPLGHTAGRVGDAALNREIVAAALGALSDDTPGRITDLPHRWADDDDWKDAVMRVSESSDGEKQADDDRVARDPTPQYQTDDDATAAAHTHDGQECHVCAGIDY